MGVRMELTGKAELRKKERVMGMCNWFLGISSASWIKLDLNALPRTIQFHELMNFL